MNPEPCGHHIRIFFYPVDVTRSNPVPYREINSQDGCRGLHGACSVTSISLRIPSTRVNLDTFRISVDWQIRFEYATRGWKYL